MRADEASMARLMQLAQQGDSDAYRALLRACQDWLTAYFRRKLPPDEVGDMVQEVLLGLHAKRGSWSPTRPFLPWLAAIARYRWVDHLRSHYRRRTMDEPAPDIGSTLDADAMMARISLDQLVRQLPDGQATALRLVKIEGLSVAEASARSGQSESLIKVNIHRACKSLRALIEDA
jgi:RNA polymerase sigma-70 factor (ECF subfamily)